MKSATSLSDDDISGFADGQLSPDRQALVTSALEHDPILAARVNEIRRQNSAVRDAFDPWLAEPLSGRLLDAATPPRMRTAKTLRRWLPALATAASLIIGVGLGWMMRGEMLEHAGGSGGLDRLSVELGQPSDHRFVILHISVPEKLDEIVGHFFNVLQGIRTVGMAAQLYFLPGRKVGGDVAPAFGNLVV